jgi:hypothetical protein
LQVTRAAVIDKLNCMNIYDTGIELCSHKNKNNRALQHAIPD